MCCFTAKHTALRRRTGWLVIRIMCPSGTTCLPADCYFSEVALLTDPGSLNLTDISYRLRFSFVSFACIVRSFFVFRSFAFRACNLFVCFVYRSFRVSFASLIRRTHERTIHETNDTRYTKRTHASPDHVTLINKPV